MMNSKSRLWAASVASVASVLTAKTVVSQKVIQVNSHNVSQEQVQTAGVSLKLEDLEQPHLLVVTIAKGNIDGKIELNEQFLTRLQDSDNRINVSPHLSRGRNRIKISGSYNPKQAQVTIKLVGTHAQVTQQVSGKGALNHLIIVEVY